MPPRPRLSGANSGARKWQPHTIHPSSRALSLAAVKACSRNSPSSIEASGSLVRLGLAMRCDVPARFEIRHHEVCARKGDDDIASLHFDVEIACAHRGCFVARSRCSSSHSLRAISGGGRRCSTTPPIPMLISEALTVHRLVHDSGLSSDYPAPPKFASPLIDHYGDGSHGRFLVTFLNLRNRPRCYQPVVIVLQDAIVVVRFGVD